MLVVVNVIEYSCQPNFRSSCHGRKQDASYKRGYAGTSFAFYFSVPFLNHKSHFSSFAKSAAACSTASDECLTQNLGQKVIPENFLACGRDNSHNIARSDWKGRPRHRCMNIAIQVRPSRFLAQLIPLPFLAPQGHLPLDGDESDPPYTTDQHSSRTREKRSSSTSS